MKTVTIEQAVADLESVFGLTESTRLHEIGSRIFLFDKLFFPRKMIVEKLTEYFGTHKIKNGGCYIYPEQARFSHFEIAYIKRLNKLMLFNQCTIVKIGD